MSNQRDLAKNTTVGRALLTAADAAAQRTTLGLGSAATLTAGTSANNLVQLNGSAQLPAVSGALLTNLPSSLPSQTGNSGKFLTTNGTSASWGDAVGTLGTAQNTTSGTSINFTGIPAGVKRITVMLSGVSTNGSSNLMIQIGSGTFNTSGYNGATYQHNGVSFTDSTGINLTSSSGAADVVYGVITLVRMSGNTWCHSHSVAKTSVAASGAGGVSLSGVLDRVRLTTVNGTDTFDAGSINIMYE